MNTPLLSNDKAQLLLTLIEESRRPKNKTYDFFILHCSTGKDGSSLPDATFAAELRDALEQEKLMNGKKVKVARACERNQNIEAIFRDMSRSYVVLVVFSEAALQTFAGDAHGHGQNNYLLFLQFALKLHDACGVRILGLNMVARGEGDESRHFIKFQGWCVRFNNIPHSSTWIQDSISHTMVRIFALQGMNIDMEDWEYRVPAMFTSLYTFQDDINATGWASTLKIVPWRFVADSLLTFALSLYGSLLGFFITTFALCFIKTKKKKKEILFTLIMIGAGLNLLLLAAALLGAYLPGTATTNTPFGGLEVAGNTKLYRGAVSLAERKLCYNQVNCEMFVQAGQFWSFWKGHLHHCPGYNDTDAWRPSFSPQAAECICERIRRIDKRKYTKYDHIYCTDQQLEAVYFGVASASAVLTGLGLLTLAMMRLKKQTLDTKKIKLGTKRQLTRENALILNHVV